MKTKKMKNLKFPFIVLLVAGLLTIAFIRCKKDSLTPSVTSDAKGGKATIYTVPDRLVQVELYFLLI
jgi:hypothetical protein